MPGPVVGERRDGTDDGRPAFADEASAEAAEAGGRPGSHSQSYDPSKVPSTRRGRVKSRGSVSGENTISEMNTAPSDMLQHATTLLSDANAPVPASATAAVRAARSMARIV